MTWIYAAVGVALAGLLPVAVLTVRLLAAVRALAREVDRAVAGLEPLRARPASSPGVLGGQGGE